MAQFRRFVGIDWSGASSRSLKGLAVAQCDAAGSLSLVDGPHKGKWSRPALLDWLLALPDGVAVAIDSAFALPYRASGYYLSILKAKNGPDLWAEIDALCVDDPHLGAASFKSFIKDYVHSERTPGRHYSRALEDKLRYTERWYNSTYKERCESVYHLIGPSQVGMSAFTTMRVLNRLVAHARYSVWPFMPIKPAGVTVFETFATTWRAGAKGKLRDLESLSPYLARLGAHYEGALPSDDAADALLMAAGIRHSLQGNSMLNGLIDKSVTKDQLRREGWIVAAEADT